MKQMSTNLFRTVIFIVGIAVLVLSIILFPWAAGIAIKVGAEIRGGIVVEWSGIILKIGQELSFMQYTFLFGLYASVIPFYFALYQTLKLLNYIDRNNSFSELSVNALNNIKYSAIIICFLYISAVIPVIYLIAEVGDAPGLILIGLAASLAPVTVATLSAVLQKLLKEAINYKLENDLTV